MNSINLKQIIRNLKNNKLYSVITIFGLAVGMAATILLFIYTQNELSYDLFNVKHDRIYRINSIITEESTTVYPICIGLNDSTLQKEVPEIEELLQIYEYRSFSPTELYFGEARFKDITLIYSDPNIHKVFTLKYLIGNPEEALVDPFSLVLTKSLALKVFGRIDVLGQTLKSNNSKSLFTITGVIEDIPSTSHLKYDAISPLRSSPFNVFKQGLELQTFVLFNEKSSIVVGLKKTKNCYNKILALRFNDRVIKTDCFLQQLKDVYLKSDFQSKNGYDAPLKKVYIYLSLALIVLLIAIINFINLLTVQYEGKSKEIGIQKAIGASRKHIIFSFLGKSIAFSFIALIIAVILVEFLIPSFGQILNRDLISTYRHNLTLIVGLPMLAILVGLISGAYPAFIVSKYSPYLAIKGVAINKRGSNMLTKVLVIMQFSIAIFLITNLIVINRQISYMKSIDLGFNAENVVAISNLNDKLVNSYPAIKDALKKLPEIKSIGASFHQLGAVSSGQGIEKVGETPSKYYSIREYRVFPGFFETLGFKFIDGRPFDENILSDKEAIVLNETAVKVLNLTDPLKAEFIMNSKMHVIGVVKDFHYTSLEESIEPLMFTYYNKRIRNIVVKTTGGNLQADLKKFEKVIKEFDSGYSIDYTVLNDFCRNRYGSQEQTATLSTYASVLSLILALLGIYALSMFMVQKRTKEIGIRKVNGANRLQILQMLFNTYTQQIVISFIIASPFAYFVLDSWLKSFAYRIELTFIPFITSGLIALGVTIITVFWQSWSVASKNPVESLRYE